LIGIYPNPASGLLTIRGIPDGVCTYTIGRADGGILQTGIGVAIGGEAQITIQCETPGACILTLYSRTGKALGVLPFVRM
ncbi:MAG: hypothetical protein RJA20_2481, partial [Bacteroidota bacterium]|jgi:hypothetical protein